MSGHTPAAVIQRIADAAEAIGRQAGVGGMSAPAEIVHITLMSADYNQGTLTMKVDGDMPVMRGRKYALVNAADLFQFMVSYTAMGKTITELNQMLTQQSEQSPTPSNDTLQGRGEALSDYDYNELWDAIAKATRIDGGIIAISVRTFRAALQKDTRHGG